MLFGVIVPPPWKKTARLLWIEPRNIGVLRIVLFLTSIYGTSVPSVEKQMVTYLYRI